MHKEEKNSYDPKNIYIFVADQAKCIEQIWVLGDFQVVSQYLADDLERPSNLFLDLQKRFAVLEKLGRIFNRTYFDV